MVGAGWHFFNRLSQAVTNGHELACGTQAAHVNLAAVKKVTDINITSKTLLPSPVDLCGEIAKTPGADKFVAETREAINRIIFGDDRRLLVVVGPCSIHDLQAGRAYAEKLAALSRELQDRLLIVMRVYFEKPRTTVGWKGLIMDPNLDGTSDIPSGLRIARQFLLDIIEMGLPTATELLDPITPQYIADLICWSAVGARTTESQTHRQMASGLSMPLGFKNGTDGSLDVAINAIKAANQPQTFLGIDNEGRANALTTKGNPHCHVVLRGGSHGPNYGADDVAQARQKLQDAGLQPAVMTDCSHANSGKDPSRQPEVFAEVVQQSLHDPSVIGAMIESNLEHGSQAFPQPVASLKYGVSITDGCIDWPTTEAMLRDAHAKLAPLFP
jgi:3-deoxy-7-phosphoheptulonate synthase